VSSPHEPATDQLEAFAAAVAHELRTPLAALSGEVDVALRRERSAAAYRDALARIAASVAELVELTGDLSFLGQQSDDEPLTAKRARLDRILARVVERYASDAAIAVAIDPALKDAVVAGEEALLTRAVTLVVEHAVRHRRDRARLTVRAARLADPAPGAPRVEIALEGGDGAFWPHTWQSLSDSPEQTEPSPALGSGPLRLRTADRVFRRCGGSLHALSPAAGTIGIHIRLREAEPV
jgi:signal transduction histidine kinase